MLGNFGLHMIDKPGRAIHKNATHTEGRPWRPKFRRRPRLGGESYPESGPNL
ncbi:hypothetical protein JOF48_001361 [Arthrobacter stackebrandtii]|uniref:Uncharacterized protein n=1 Tax=Arthrobacter stackebrandtii TaxID=272161 RepID=A0ABS4YUT8_9MICC|nr:hypothetical protein [Arthrobacter stackebrandtii]